MQELNSVIVVTIESSKESQKNFQTIHCQILKKKKNWKKNGKKKKREERCRKLRNGSVSIHHEHDTLWNL